MKSVLISIKPKWCGRIAFGNETIEVRKTRPKINTPFKCYIYQTQGYSSVPLFIDENGHFSRKTKGFVIGDFVCDTMIPMSNDTYVNRIFGHEQSYNIP